jgi:hypothetical protein
MINKIKILIVQETDWILRGPHTHHHIFGRLDPKKFIIRICDFPLIWEKSKRRNFPILKGFSNIITNFKINNNKVRLSRPAYINLPIMNLISIFIQRILIRREVKSFKPDLIICFASLLNVNYVCRICKKNRIKFLYFIFEKYYNLIPFKVLRFIGKLKMQKALINSDYNIALTLLYKDYLDIYCKNRNKNKYLPQGVDLSHFNPNLKSEYLQKKYNLHKDDIILFFMGWIYRFSGIMEVIYSIENLVNNHTKLILVGEGDLFAEIKKFVLQKDLKEKIVLTGWIPYKDIPDILSIADFCLLPAYKNKIMNDIVPIKINLV